MVNLKYVLKNISRNSIMFLLIIIQLSISIGIIYSVISYGQYMSNFSKKINNVISNLDNTWLIKSNDLNPFKLKLETVENFRDYLSQSEEFDFVSSISENFVTRHFENVDEFLQTTNIVKNNNEDFYALKGIAINEKAYKYFDLKVHEGEDFKDIDYKKNQEEIPIILGYSYYNIFKVGDTIEYLRGEKIKKSKVVGILKDNTLGICGDPNNGIVSFNDYVILPQVGTSNNHYYNDDVDKSTSLFTYIFNGFIVIKNDKNKEKVFEDIEKVSVENSIDLKFSSLAKNMNDLKNNSVERQQSSLALGTIILIFSIVGLVSSLLHSINKNIKEYGVHLMSGATKRQMISRILMQITIIVTISYLIALNYIAIKFKDVAAIKLNSMSIFYTTILVVILIVIISILPGIKMLKLDINQLMKEDL